MRVLGIDPGSRFTGYGVVDQDSGRLTYVTHGIIRADSTRRLEFRLSEIFAQLSSVAKLYQPHAVAVEGLFFFRNARSALVLGQARGIALLVAAQMGLPVYEYSPAKVKKAVGAGGAARKAAVARMVTIFLGQTTPERQDATDALAIAICHLNQHRESNAVKPRRHQPLADRLTPAYRYLGNGR